MAAAEIPEPTPSRAAQRIEGLIGCRAKKPLPIDFRCIHLGQGLVDHVVLIPRSQHQRYLAELAFGDNLPRLKEVRPASLLIAYLHDLFRIQDGLLHALALADG